MYADKMEKKKQEHLLATKKSYKYSKMGGVLEHVKLY